MAALENDVQDLVAKTKDELTGGSLGAGLQDVVAGARDELGGQKLEGGINNLVGSAKGEYSDFKHLAHDAVTSKAYLYPVKVNTS
jgi:maltose-binding protein MalE